jgi:integrase
MIERKYKAIKGRPNLRKIVQIDSSGKELTTGYSGRRWEFDPSSGKRRVQRDFKSLSEAQKFVQGFLVSDTVEDKTLFGLVLDKFLSPSSGKRNSTLIRYRDIAKGYLYPFFEIPIREITPVMIDQWIDWLLSEESGFISSSRRKTFKHELDLLSGVLNYFSEYDDTNTFINPVKKRHRKAVKLNHGSEVKDKNLTEHEFSSFLRSLKGQRNGGFYSAISVIQYFHALRVSEVAGIFWEDVFLDFENPLNSRLTIRRMVEYPRVKGANHSVVPQYKNSRTTGVKEHPLYPESFAVFSSLWQEGAKGPIFTLDGKLPSYRMFQYAYDRAMADAGLNFTGTHIMRHGGCRTTYNESGGDISVAQQLLGNSDLKSTLVYAKREAAALNKVVNKRWEDVARGQMGAIAKMLGSEVGISIG